MNRTRISFLPPFIRARLEGRGSLQNILKNTGWLVGDKVIRMGIGLVVSVWVARYLGPQQFGILNYALSFVSLFMILSYLGLDGIVVRELVQHPSDKREILGTAFLLRFACGLLAFCLAIGTIRLLRPDDALMLRVVAITAVLTLTQAFDVIDMWFQSQVASKYTVLARNTAFLLITGVRVALILTHAPFMAFVWAAMAEYALGAVALVIVYQGREQLLPAWRASRERAGRLLRDSWPLLLASFSMVVYQKIDQVMLGEMLGNDVVGIYAAAAKISEIWYFIPMTIVSSIFPSVLKARAENQGLYYRRLQRLFSLMTAMALALAVPMTFAARYLMPLVYGQEFNAAAPILAIHIWAGVFVFMGVAQSSWDLAENLTRLFLLRSTCGAIINIALNLLLIPLYAGLGAAIATVISYACAYYFMNALSSRTRPIFICQSKSFFFIRYLREMV
jgi:PST family polysaccharide transporter